MVKLNGEPLIGTFGKYDKASFSHDLLICKNETVKLDRFQLPHRYRHKGYGPKILNHLLQLYKRAGCEKVIVPSPNSQGTKCYKKVGFVPNAMRTLEFNFKDTTTGQDELSQGNRSPDIDPQRILINWSLPAESSSECSPDCSPEKTGQDELSQGNRTQSEDVASRKTSTTISQSAGSQPAFKPRGKPREGFTWGEDMDLTDTSIRNPTGSPGEAELSQGENGDDELSQGEDEAVESESDFSGSCASLESSDDIDGGKTSFECDDDTSSSRRHLFLQKTSGTSTSGYTVQITIVAEATKSLRREYPKLN